MNPYRLFDQETAVWLYQIKQQTNAQHKKHLNDLKNRKSVVTKKHNLVRGNYK